MKNTIDKTYRIQYLNDGKWIRYFETGSFDEIMNVWGQLIENNVGGHTYRVIRVETVITTTVIGETQ